jgi:hypothetical protein
MSLTYDLVSRTLVALDPFRSTWHVRSAAPPRGTAALWRRLLRLRTRAQGEQAGRSLGDIAHLLRFVDPARAFGVFLGVPPIDDRQPIVLAHGPSLRTLLPAIAAERQHLYVVAPLRTALRLAEADVWPDVVVLADAAPQTSEISSRAWQAAPASVRQGIEARATLVIEPLAPAAIHRGFPNVRVFDGGIVGLPSEATLPFWGSALLPSVCLPLALGAATVAVGGMDMGASHGRASFTWSGRATRLDPQLSVAHGVLEALATALPGRCFDVSAESVVKRGFAHAALTDLIARPKPHAASVPDPGVSVRASDVLDHVLDAAAACGGAVSLMAAVASRVCDLVTEGDASRELSALIETMECDWAREPGCRNALSLLQPPYLRALWQLRAAGFTSRDPRASARMKGKLIGPEIAALADAYKECLTAIRGAARS